MSGGTGTEPRVLGTYDSQAEAYVVLNRFRRNERSGNFDIIDVRRADPPIRSVNRWAVVRYV